MDSRSAPAPSEMHEVAGKIFRGLARSYDRTLDLATLFQDRYWKDWVLQRAKVGRSDRILDIGCGTCVLEERLEGTGSRVVGLDLTRDMLRMGLAKGLSSAGELLNADAEALPFPDESFDLVLSCYVVKYCDLGRFASELARVLKPGGRVVLYDFVRPRGFAAPFLAFYIYGLLGVAGWLIGLVDRGISYTLGELPGIIKGSRWNDGLFAEFARFHLETVERKVLSGGAVEAFVARKTPA